MKVSIVGLGVIGQKRAIAVSNNSRTKLHLVCDINSDLAQYTGEKFNCDYTNDWEKAVSEEKIDVVIVSTINKSLVPIGLAALRNGKHVLIEKPPGRNYEESKQIAEAVTQNKKKLKVGFNHRYHPSYIKLIELLNAGEIGQVYYIRSNYGHGGRQGYDKEWRADPDLSGGGEILDQGIHIIDLAHTILGNFSEVFAYTPQYFWKVAPLEDNGFALLKNGSGQILSLHASWTQWKNLFRFEVFGEKGYLIIEGLGGSYGKEILRFGLRNTESGPPDETVFEFNDVDPSWELEWQEFTNAILYDYAFQANATDGLKALEVIDAIYQSHQTGEKVTL